MKITTKKQWKLEKHIYAYNLHGKQGQFVCFLPCLLILPCVHPMQKCWYHPQRNSNIVHKLFKHSQNIITQIAIWVSSGYIQNRKIWLHTLNTFLQNTYNYFIDTPKCTKQQVCRQKNISKVKNPCFTKHNLKTTVFITKQHFHDSPRSRTKKNCFAM